MILSVLLEEKLKGIPAGGKLTGTIPLIPDIRVETPSRPAEKERAQTEEAHRSFSAGKYSEAENGYFRAIFLYPDHSDAYVGLALCALVRGAYAEAWSFLSRILRRNPDFLKEARSPLLYFGSEDEYLKFRTNLEVYLGDNPLDPDAKLLKAWLDIYEKGGNYGKSLASELPGNADAENLIRQMEAPYY